MTKLLRHGTCVIDLQIRQIYGHPFVLIIAVLMSAKKGCHFLPSDFFKSPF
jgi:hypothetical protein